MGQSIRERSLNTEIEGIGGEHVKKEIGRKRLSFEYITFHYDNLEEIREHQKRLYSEGWSYECQFEQTFTYIREIQFLDRDRLLQELRDRLEPAFPEEMVALERLAQEIESGKFDTK